LSPSEGPNAYPWKQKRADLAFARGKPVLRYINLVHRAVVELRCLLNLVRAHPKVQLHSKITDGPTALGHPQVLLHRFEERHVVGVEIRIYEAHLVRASEYWGQGIGEIASLPQYRWRVAILESRAPPEALLTRPEARGRAFTADEKD